MQNITYYLIMIFSLIENCPLGAPPLFLNGFQLCCPLTSGLFRCFLEGPSVLEALLDLVDPLVTELAGELDKSPD